MTPFSIIFNFSVACIVWWSFASKRNNFCWLVLVGAVCELSLKQSSCDCHQCTVFKGSSDVYFLFKGIRSILYLLKKILSFFCWIDLCQVFKDLLFNLLKYVTYWLWTDSSRSSRPRVVQNRPLQEVLLSAAPIRWSPSVVQWVVAIQRIASQLHGWVCTWIAPLAVLTGEGAIWMCMPVKVPPRRRRGHLCHLKWTNKHVAHKQREIKSSLLLLLNRTKFGYKAYFSHTSKVWYVKDFVEINK